MTSEGENEDTRNIDISKAKCHREVEGLQIENLDITVPLKTKQVHIGIEAEPKLTKIGDYKDDATVDKAVELLHKYQDFFPTKFLYVRGIIRDLGVMKFILKRGAKPIK